MFFYLLAALALAAGLVLLSMALRHQTLLDPRVERELQDRLAKLSPDSPRRWGRMSPGQMLRHLAGAIRMATGDLQIAPRNTPLRFFPIKQLVVFVLPFPPDAPTAPALVVKEEVDFAAERRAVSELLGAFPKRNLGAWPEHPAFGALNREQWGVLVWKHADHHFRQFGV
jgi:hypothetical protein